MIGTDRVMRLEPLWHPTEHHPLVDLLDLATQGWRDDAACAGAPWALFDPAEHGESRHAAPYRVRHAITRYCDDCPVRERCGEYADEHKLTGVYGGTWRAGAGKNYRSRTVPPASGRPAA